MKISGYWAILVLFLMIQACVPSKKLLYVQPEHENDKDAFVNIKVPRTIQPTDELYIKVLSTDVKTSTIMSRENFENRDRISVDLISYRVSETGTIDFPFLGEVYVKDLNLDQARKKLLEELQAYMKNASVVIKFVNSRVTVIGEVNKPGEYQYFHEQISIFRALGMAGGVSQFGNKKDVVLIREMDNSLQYIYLDLTKKDIVGSEYYYLKPNDIVLVNPIKAKFWSMTSFNWGTFLSAITTALSLLYYFKTP